MAISRRQALQFSGALVASTALSGDVKKTTQNKVKYQKLKQVIKPQ